MTVKRTATVLGATGLAGSHLVRILQEDDSYEKIITPVRRSLKMTGDRVKEVFIDYDRLDDYRDVFRVDDVFCCLGTTMKRAGSREAFEKVDFHYVVESARLASEENVTRFLVITAMMANAKSPVFYNRVKGRVEEALKAMSFHSLHIFRPSLLLGQRNEQRFAEELGMKILPLLSFIMVGPLRKYRPVQAEQVAVAMKRRAFEDLPGVHTWEGDSLVHLE